MGQTEKELANTWLTHMKMKKSKKKDYNTEKTAEDGLGTSQKYYSKKDEINW
jgi:hypothetical protein